MHKTHPEVLFLRLLTDPADLTQAHMELDQLSSHQTMTL